MILEWNYIQRTGRAKLMEALVQKANGALDWRDMVVETLG
jgi:hypothetical protein